MVAYAAESQPAKHMHGSTASMLALAATNNHETHPNTIHNATFQARLAGSRTIQRNAAYAFNGLLEGQ